MDTSTIVWIVIVVIVVLILLGLLAWAGRRRKLTHDRSKAEEMRVDAGTRRQSADDAHWRAQEAEAEAQRKQAEAERAQARAQESRVGAQQEQALHEEQLREADRVDPDVDHRADDYAPGRTTETDPEADTLGGPQHRG